MCRYLSTGLHLFVFSGCSFPCTSFVCLLPLAVPALLLYQVKNTSIVFGDWRQLRVLLVCVYDLLGSYLTMLTNATVIWIALVWKIWAESSPLMAKIPFTFGPVKNLSKLYCLTLDNPKQWEKKEKRWLKFTNVTS